MFENTHWTLILAYWLAWAIGLGLLRRRYVRHLLAQSVEVQRFAFGKVGQTLEGLAFVAFFAVSVGLLVFLVGYPRVSETRELGMFAWLVFGYLVYLSRAGARQQWAIEDLLRTTDDREPEQAS
ncbi:MAG: hypothetical protein V2I57_00170 [Xanthomonadales bacterium]|jgi:hypothetical protein|nr:hypothetical protein [Xanthomonadales bacterium]